MGGPFENRKAEEMALLFLSSSLSPRGDLSTTLITLASKPNQVALTSWPHLLRVVLDKRTFFSGAGEAGAGIYLEEALSVLCPSQTFLAGT